MQPKNVGTARRKVPTLAVEQRQLLEDWEFVLCDMSRLDAVAFFVSHGELLCPRSSIFLAKGRMHSAARSRNFRRVCYAAER